MNKKIKILFVMPSLFGGGAERVMLILSKYIDREKFEPIFLLMEKKGKYLKDIPDDVEVIDLNSKMARYAIFKIVKKIKEIEPDIVFSTLGYLNLLIAIIRIFFPKKIKFISRESNSVSIENQSEKYPKLFDWLYSHVYNNFDLVIAQCKYMKNDLVKNFNVDEDRVKVIYNPVDFSYISKKIDSVKKEKNSEKINLLAVGRLESQKGFDILVKTLSYLDDRFFLTILGEGSLEDNLVSLAKDLGVNEKINFVGFSDNPYRYMINSDLLVLSSRYEGLPNVVLEANACGLPCVSFDMPGGTSEIIEDGRNGLLAREMDAKSLAIAIKKAIGIGFDSKSIKELNYKKFNAKKITKEYEKAFLSQLG